jgi:hypothetical protein
MVEPMIVQPTPEGAKILAEYYREKYGVNIQVIDYTGKVDSPDNLNKRFQRLKEDFTSLTKEHKTPFGAVLMHGMQHAVPVLFDDKKHIMIFDSNSGARIKSYYVVANLFPDYQVFLNKGTRQADVGSCITDAIVILKDALRIPNLSEIIESKSFEHKEPEKPNDGRPKLELGEALKQQNFRLFRMPEELLKTAQVSKFVDEAEPDFNKIITKGDETLKQKRDQFRTTVSLNKRPEVEVGINRFLKDKGEKFADLLDKKDQDKGRE